MVLSAIAALYFSRGTTFSGDEMVWVVTSPDFSIETAFSAHAGHLQVVSRVLYWPLLEIFGLEYLPYRLLTVLSIWLMVGLLFIYMRRRVPDPVALIPCIVLLFFGSDHLHILQGNGFTICFSLAMGLLALLMLERNTDRGDICAAIALTVAVATYAVGLPFIAGAFALILAGQQWRRLWVPALPLVLYIAWLIWVKVVDAGSTGGGAEASNLTTIPEWAFQAAGASLLALTGLSFDTSPGNTVDLIGWPASLLAIALVGVVALSVVQRRATKWLLAALAIGVSLWGIQALVGSSGGRGPDESRYLYPGAVACLLILTEAARGLKWNRASLIALAAIGAIGLTTNFILLEKNGDYYRDQAFIFKGNVGAVTLAAEAQILTGELSEAQPDMMDLSELVTQRGGAALAMANVPYGEYGLTAEEMTGLPPQTRLNIDQGLFAAQNVQVTPTRKQIARNCETVAAIDGTLDIKIGSTGAYVSSRSGISDLLTSRFGDQPSIPLGPLPAGKTRRISLLPDTQTQIPWRVGGSGEDLTVCPTGLAGLVGT